MTDDPEKNQPADPNPAHEEQEMGAADDRVIAKAMRISLVVLGSLSLAALLIFVVLRRNPEPPPADVTDLQPIQNAPSTSPEVPAVHFTDITRQAGIDFVHVNGASGDKLLPETMGGGAAFLDYDADGDQDILFINGQRWPWDETPAASPATPALFRNDGTGHFDDVTSGSGLDVSLYGMGVAVGDYDNDGQVDVYITAVGKNRLFRNLGDGTFTNESAQSGTTGAPEDWSTGAAWVDVDRDGDLDLFVVNYVRWSREIDFEVGFTLVGDRRAYGPPTSFEGSFPVLFVNDGNGKFTDQSAESGVQIRSKDSGVPLAKSMAVAPIDLDQDGWMDLIVANDTVQNLLFHNQGNGSFKDIGALSGVAFDSYGKARGAMGTDTSWFRNDGTVAIGIGNFANEMTALYVSQGNPLLFADEAITEGIGPASRRLLTFGLFFFDYDLDGRLDLLCTNGHLEKEINTVQESQHYRQPAQLFWNRGPEHRTSFVVVAPEQAGPDLFKPIVGRGSAFADIDGDGDPDVLLLQAGGPPLLLRNDLTGSPNWIRLRLQGTQGNRDAIGARIMVRQGKRKLWRQIMPTRSYLSQSELPVTIGLGPSPQIDELTIVWPSGTVQSIALPPLNQQVTIKEPAKVMRQRRAGFAVRKWQAGTAILPDQPRPVASVKFGKLALAFGARPDSIADSENPEALYG